MNFLLWHYQTGLKQLFSRWLYSLGWVVHFFSLGLLLGSLFSPYKRLATASREPGFSFQRWFNTFTYNTISRFIGAFVRLFLFFIGCLVLLPVVVLGLISLVLWLICPLIGLPYYFLIDSRNQKFFTKIALEMTTDIKAGWHVLSSVPAGKFFLAHLGQTEDQLASLFRLPTIPPFQASNLTAIIDQLIASHLWEKADIRKLNLEIEDLQMVARWWDRQHDQSQAEEHRGKYPRPGIGLELLFGYTPTLNKYGTDLSVIQPFAHHLIGRDELVSRMSRILENGKAVMLYGLPGVGKKTVVYELAHKAMAGELSSAMLYKRLVELDYNVLLSQSLDLSQKKTLLEDILIEATAAGNIVLVIKDLHRLTSSDVEGLDLTDIFETALDSRKFLLIALSSQADYERYISPNQRLRKYFEPVEATPPTLEQATQILIDFAGTWESKKPLTITAPAIRAIMSGSDKYISDTPFPEKALELLDNVIAYAGKTATSVIVPDLVNAVIAETTGISLARLTEKEKTVLADLEPILHERLIGQDMAVTMIAKSLRSRSVGVKSENRPLGSFLFLGPTGVGKTETAKTLARVYYGSEEHILRFDMAEFAGSEGLERLIGSVTKNTPGRLATEIKARPASLLLLDEIEKAPPEIYNLFLSLLDEGMITDSFGRKINCKHVFVIATSNAGAEFIRQQVNAKVDADTLQKSVLEYIQAQRLFSPELLNRFDSVVVFEPLNPDQTIQIAKILLKDVVTKLDSQDIKLNITEDLAKSVATEGYEPQFGARPLRRLIDLEIGDALGKAILKKEIVPGDTIEIIPGGNKHYTIHKIV